MKSLKKPYRFFTILTLVAFISSIVLPVTVSAAGLICHIDMTDGNGNAHAPLCHHGEDHNSISTDSVKEVSDPCSYQVACIQAHLTSKNEIRALPQLTKQFSAVLPVSDISGALYFQDLNSSPTPETSYQQVRPPLFLLNSVFLN